MENNHLLDKLDGLVSRFEEVSTLITDPAVIADQKRYVKLTKEYKDLGKIVEARKEYIGCLQNVADAKEMLAIEEDAETKEMLREELSQSEKRIPELEEKIKLLLVPADPRTTRTSCSKYVAARAATRRPSSRVTFSACTPSFSR